MAKSRLPFRVGPLLAVLGLVLALVVMVDFGRQLAAAQRIAEDKHVLETQVAALETEQGALLTQIAYATTDAAVIEWAQVQGKYVQPGEVIVVPVPPPGATPVPSFTPAPSIESIPNWRLWFGLFFESDIAPIS